MTTNLLLGTFVILMAQMSLAHNILDYGAVADDSSYATEVDNSAAIYQAAVAANSTEDEDRTVEFPAGYTFSSMPILIQNVTNITFVIDGTLQASKNHEKYPTTGGNSEKIRNFFVLYDTEHITFSGKGEIDGQGFMWWVRELLKKNPMGRQSKRPNQTNRPSPAKCRAKSGPNTGSHHSGSGGQSSHQGALRLLAFSRSAISATSEANASKSSPYADRRAVGSSQFLAPACFQPPGC